MIEHGSHLERDVGPFARVAGRHGTTVSFVSHLILVLWIVVSPARSHAATIREVSRDVLSQGAYQTTLPGYAGPALHKPLGSNQFGSMPALVSNSVFGPTTVRFFKLLLYTAITILIGCGLVILVRSRWRKPTQNEEIASMNSKDADCVSLDLEYHQTADSLALDGQFSEAVHVLLLRAIEVLQLRSTIHDSLTARELLRHSVMSPVARRGFETLVATTELAHFGGRALGGDEYAICVEGFTAFRAASA
jgi:hypothetical protein